MKPSALTGLLLTAMLGGVAMDMAPPPLASAEEPQPPEVDKLRLDKAEAKRKRKAEKALKQRAST